MASPKKPFKDDVTIVPGEFLTSIFGGDDGYASADPPSPFFKGHLHDGRNDTWGHAPKVNLTDHVTGRLVSPTLELKSIRLSATQASPLVSSLFWTVPIPPDAYSNASVSTPMLLKIYWSGNSALSPSNAAFRVDWEYIQPGQNVIPPSIIALGDGYWPANTNAGQNPSVTTFRFKVNASPTRLYVNDNLSNSSLIQLSFPSTVSNAVLGDFLLFGLEITSAPTLTLQQPMSQVNIFAVELLYYSQTLGTTTTPVLLQNDESLADF